MNLSFTTTESIDGPIVRVSVDELARVTNLPVRLTWGPLVPRDLALALLGVAGATAQELHALNAAFDAELARATGTTTAQAPAAPAVAHVAPVRAPTPAHGTPLVAPPALAPQVASEVGRVAAVAETFAPRLSYDQQRAAKEREAIIAALDAAKGNKFKAAAALGMARRTLYRRLKEYGLMDASEPEPGDTGNHPTVDVPAPVRGRPKQRHVG